LISLFVAVLIACGGQRQPTVLRLATTTSLDNSGLLAKILPDFEEQYNISVNVVAVGTGQALALGELGDVDVILVHAPSLEEEFVANKFGTRRYAVAFNDFIIVGPLNDPAQITGLTSAAEAFTRIAERQSQFVSRGDNSGTHVLELSIWDAAGIAPDETMDWYLSIGQGMGASLNMANESRAYIVTDRGTFLSQSANLPNLVVLFGGGSVLENPDVLLHNFYSVIPLNPEVHPGTQTALVDEFVSWLTSVETQETIGEFGLESFGQPLFYPNSETWHAANP
jgi:tungstate transport system substrate-binding protein